MLGDGNLAAAESVLLWEYVGANYMGEGARLGDGSIKDD